MTLRTTITQAPTRIQTTFGYPRRFVEDLLSAVDVRLDGDRPWDVQVHDERLFRRVLASGSLGLGEAYMEGWWDCRRLDELFFRLLRGGLHRRIVAWTQLGRFLRAAVVNLQSTARAFEVGRRHYDIGDDLYEAMLDRRMVYSCGYWKDAADLQAAQEAKLALICRKLDLRPGLRVLDIGCGWGGALEYAARTYGVRGVGVTVSRNQAEHARRRCAGLPVDIRLQDYRDLDEPFDRILSVGMFEHVGTRNHRTFMEVARRCLRPDGLFLLHTIGSDRTTRSFDPWMARYIFPNSKLPSAPQISRAADGLFVLEDWHDFGPDYDRTLMAWHANIEARWSALGDRYDHTFRRMWRYYLLSCAGSFRARVNQLWQIVLSPHGVPGGYASVR